jgi:hypothetical protein
VAEAFGDVVRVLPGRFDSPQPDTGTLAGMPHEFMMFVSLQELAGHEGVRQVGSFPVPAHGTWNGQRFSVMYRPDLSIRHFALGDGRTAASIHETLPPAAERRSVPIWLLRPASYVLDVLSASQDGELAPAELDAWRDATGRNDPPAPGPASEEPVEPGVEHLAVFPKRASLDEVMAELGGLGFSSAVRAAPDFDGQLLVIKPDPAVAPGFIDDQWGQIEAIVTAAGGEYDGWEAPVL